MLDRVFFATDAGSLARALLGRVLVRTLDDGTRLAGQIVETEAYLGPEDAAAHSKGGRRTARNEAMYARAGTCYVFFTYGVHHCVNIVCEREGHPAAVLIRALEPTEGLERMLAHRQSRSKAPLRARDLCSGPGKLCQAMGITLAQNGLDLCAPGSGLHVEAGEAIEDSGVVRTTRIGVDYAGAWAAAELRWYVRGSAHVSVRECVPRRAHSAHG